MKKNRNLGAACGRIHPVGSGNLSGLSPPDDPDIVDADGFVFVCRMARHLLL